jgi:hypothetical protein
MSVTRPESLIIINTEMEFNLRDFKKLEVDLKHINEGKDQTRVVISFLYLLGSKEFNRDNNIA